MFSYSPSTDYNVNPAPRSGNTAYGQVPGPIGIPPNYWQQMQSIYPVTSQAGAAANVIGSQLAGQLTPEELAMYQTESAQFGAARGSPLSDMSGRAGLLSVGRKVSDVQQEGLTNYQNMLKTLSGTLTPQDLAAGIASRNATMAAAPDPRLAAEQQIRDWMDKFRFAQQQSQGPAGPARGGSTIVGGPPPSFPAPGGGGGPNVPMGGTGPFNTYGVGRDPNSYLPPGLTYGQNQGFTPSPGGGYTYTGAQPTDFPSAVNLYAGNNLTDPSFLGGLPWDSGTTTGSSDYLNYPGWYEDLGVDEFGYPMDTGAAAPAEGSYDTGEYDWLP